MKRAWWLGLLLLGASSCEEVTGPSGYLATFDDAAGLKPGGPVYVAGVKVGRVKTVSLEEGKAKVELVVESQHGITMTDGACVGIGRYAFDSETHVALVPSKDGKPLESGDALTCIRAGSPLTERMDQASAKMLKILDAALDDDGTIGRLLADRELADDVVRFFRNGPPAAAPPDTPPPTEEEGEGGADDGTDEDDKGAAEPKPPPPAPPAPASKPPPPPPADLKDPFQ